jgi:peptidoglycan/LPS O-acetylase OafA/YrhL
MPSRVQDRLHMIPTPQSGPSDVELAEVVGRMRRVRRRNRLAHVAACITLVIVACTVYSLYGELTGRSDRLRVLLSAGAAVLAAVAVHERLKSKEAESADD